MKPVTVIIITAIIITILFVWKFQRREVAEDYLKAEKLVDDLKERIQNGTIEVIDDLKNLKNVSLVVSPDKNGGMKKEEYGPDNYSLTQPYTPDPTVKEQSTSCDKEWQEYHEPGPGEYESAAQWNEYRNPSKEEHERAWKASDKILKEWNPSTSYLNYELNTVMNSEHQYEQTPSGQYMRMGKSEGYSASYETVDDPWRPLYYEEEWPATEWPLGLYDGMVRWTPTTFVEGGAHPWNTYAWWLKPGFFKEPAGKWFRYGSGFVYAY